MTRYHACRHCGAELENGAQQASGFCSPACDAAYGPQHPEPPTWTPDVPWWKLGPYQSQWD